MITLLYLYIARNFDSPRSRVPRAARKSLYSLLLPRDMGDDRSRCWVLDCYAHPQEMVAGLVKHSLLIILPDSSGESRRESKESERDVDIRTSQSELEQGQHTVPQICLGTVTSTTYEVSTACHTHTATRGRTSAGMAIFRWASECT